MSVKSRSANSGAGQAEVVLLPQLKSCLANLPPALVSGLVNANTVCFHGVQQPGNVCSADRVR